MRTADLPVPDASLCTARCRLRGYPLAGLVWNGPERGPAGFALTQCYCARNLGEFGRDRSRQLPIYQCCPTCLNYDLRVRMGWPRPPAACCHLLLCPSLPHPPVAAACHPQCARRWIPTLRSTLSPAHR